MLRRRRGLAAGALLLTLAMVSGCGQGEEVNTSEPGGSVVVRDGPTYETVREVGKAGNIVVRGLVGKEIATELDGGGEAEESEENSSKVAFVSLKVTASSNENVVARGSTVPVLVDPRDLTSSTDLLHLDEGDEVVLAAVSTSRDQAPGIESVEAFLAPVGGTAGVFDVEGARARSRDPEVAAMTSDEVSGASENNRLDVPVEDLWQELLSSSR